MAVKFGTSGLRGLIEELTPEVVSDYVLAFLDLCPTVTMLFVGRDLRPSSMKIAEGVKAAARPKGLHVIDCGAVPTPALALAAFTAGGAAVMVTGSHIPSDRNGLKFYLPQGEICKADEAKILRVLGQRREAPQALASLSYASVGQSWVERYVAAFGAEALQGLKIGVWSQSAVSRDLLCACFRALGAEVCELDRRSHFLPLDTEALPDWAHEKLAEWAQRYHLDAVVSTDGDGDRPLLADAAGRVVAGDILGQITARVAGAEHIATPITSNSGVELSGHFKRVIRTKVGSPYVIEAMAELGGNVAGYEANGGFLLGFEAELQAGKLSPLRTRDSLLPLIAPLSLAKAAGGIAALVQAEPARATAAGRLENVPTDLSTALLARFELEPVHIVRFLAPLGETALGLDVQDGLRLHCASKNILHLRASGNAPELRLYVEAQSKREADYLLEKGLVVLSEAVLRAKEGESEC